jgi:hypothetical protein
MVTVVHEFNVLLLCEIKSSFIVWWRNISLYCCCMPLYVCDCAAAASIATASEQQ